MQCPVDRSGHGYSRNRSKLSKGEAREDLDSPGGTVRDKSRYERPIPTQKIRVLSLREVGGGAYYLDAMPSAASLRQMARSRSGFSG
jgi:hypothetical protein